MTQASYKYSILTNIRENEYKHNLCMSFEKKIISKILVIRNEVEYFLTYL
jgi:hypothetical protein